MKRIKILCIPISILLSLCQICLTSCQKQEISCYRIFDRLSETFSFGECELYPYSSDLSDASFFSRLYLGVKKEEKPHPFSYCDDYTVALSSSSILWELHIFHVNSGYDSAAVREMLRMRRDRLQSSETTGFYDEVTEERISKALIFTVDNYIIMAITDTNEAIEQTARNFIR